jgi:hypothetical protein
MLLENVIALAFFSVALCVFRYLLERQLKDFNAERLSQPEEPIRPVELSFLASGGDMSDVLTVLAVDLLQRALKSKANGSDVPRLVDYEEKLWLVTKRYVSDSATDIIGSVSPDKILSDPLGYVRRISVIYRALIKLLRTFTKEVISDPRRLRKYFSFGWITRLVLDFSSSDFRERLRSELVGHLTGKGLLVTSAKKKEKSKQFMALGFAFIVFSLAFLWFKLGLLAAAIMFTSALVTAGILRASFYLAGFLPLYSEFTNVLNHIDRNDWRINGLRVLIRTLKVLGILGGVFIFVSGAVTGWLAVNFAMQQFSLPALYLELLSIVVLFLSIDTFWRGVEIANTEVATARGDTRLRQVRSRLSTMGPIGAFREMLEDAEYNPSFSEILAIYGIEPLLFLA